MDMDFTIDLIIYALEKNSENDLFEMWKLQFPNMNKENYISFKDYKDKFISKKHTEMSNEDIEKEMAKVEKAFAERR
jgi:hypothetical protein